MYRRSPRASGSSIVSASGSLNTPSASANQTPCFLTFAAAFAGSYWYRIRHDIYYVCMSLGRATDSIHCRRPRPRFKHSRAGFSGDPVSFVQKKLDSLPAFAGTKGRGNDDLQNPLLRIRLTRFRPLIPTPSQIQRLMSPVHHQLGNRARLGRDMHHPVPGKSGDRIEPTIKPKPHTRIRMLCTGGSASLNPLASGRPQ